MKRKVPLPLLRLRRPWIPYIILVSTLLMTAMVTYYVESRAHASAQLRFENSVQRTQNAIREQLETYMALLRSGTGLFAAIEDPVSHRQFQAYVEQLELKRNYPGIQGIGFSRQIAASDLKAVTKEMQRQGFEDFQINPSYSRPEYHAILYLEPLDQRNQVAIGYDMFTESVRRAAMERARDQAAPAASGRVTLMQEIESQKQAGFLLYMPIYEGGKIPLTVPERRANLVGFIYSPFRADDFMAGIFGDYSYPYVDLNIYDGKQIRPDSLLHCSSCQPSRALHRNYRPRFTTTRTLDVAGQPWTLTFTSRPQLDQHSEHGLVPLIMVSGVAVSLSLFGVTRSQVQARTAAEDAATDLRDSQTALSESEALFRTLIETTFDGIVIHDQGLILEANQGIAHIFGYGATDLIGRSILDLATDDSRNILLQKIQTGFNQPYELQGKRRDGSIVSLEVLGKPHVYQGRPVRVTALRDISDRKQLEAQLRARADQLAETNRLKDEFLASLSHELRTPLNAMLGWTQMLNSRRLSEETFKRATETIDRNTRSLAQLIEDLLDVSRIITGKLQLNLRPTLLMPVIESAIETVRATADAKSIQIQTYTDSAVGLIRADANRLQQVIWNLLANAIKFTPENGKVEVRLEQVEGLDSSQWIPNGEEWAMPTSAIAQITITDTGQGIDPSFLPHIFERFRQADGSTTRRHGGLGLGLAIVHHLVELHGGTVQADSLGLGTGSTFTVRLPLMAAASWPNGNQVVPAATQMTNLPASLQNVHLLVVDDEADTRELLLLVLQERGAIVNTAATVREAIELFQRDRPHVLISDISMPEEDGYMLIRQVRALEANDGQSTPAIALTAYARSIDRDATLQAGFQVHLAKPIEPHTLVEAIESLVQRSNQAMR